MTRIVLTPGEMLRTAGTLGKEAAALGGLGARIPADAATLMPPDLAGDVASTIARVEVTLASVAGAYVVQGGDLAARAAAAQAGDVGGRLLDAAADWDLAIDLAFALGDRRFFIKGRFSPLKWMTGGHRWAYRNGLKSLLKRDFEVLRGVARRSSAAWGSLVGSAGKGLRTGASTAKGLLNDVRRASGLVIGRGRAAAVSAGKRLLRKAMVPISFRRAYNTSHARSTAGKATSAVLRTAVGLAPPVAIFDWLTGDPIDGAFDMDVVYIESAITREPERATELAQQGRYGPLWQGYHRFLLGF
jgi:hypothetical protein